jgi:hypothetical protein
MILSLIPLPARLAIAVASLAVVVAGIVAWGSHKDSVGYSRGTAEVQARWTAEDLKRAQVAAAAQEAARAEEQRRTAAQKEATDEADKKLARARADVVIADAAAGRLQQRVSALLSAARGGQVPVDPTATQPGQAADDAAGVLANVLFRCVGEYRRMAAIADERGTAGEACVKSYDALTAP